MPAIARLAALAGAAALLAAIAACKSPGYSAGGPQASIDQFTFESRPDFPTTVTLLDWTTSETIWTFDVPVGKQLTVRFYPGKAGVADPRRPDLMRWEVQNMGTEYGELDNAMPVPASTHRRIDTTYRDRPDAVARTLPAAVPPAEPVGNR